MNMIYYICFFFFQAEDGIRDWSVTGVQTCALPISRMIEIDNTVFHLIFLNRPNNKIIVNLKYRHSHDRSEEHTSELQSLTNLVCRLLLEKKKKKKKNIKKDKNEDKKTKEQRIKHTT